MEHLIATKSDLEEALEMRRCPHCGKEVGFVHFSTLEKDESSDIKEQDYYRCLRCLKLFTLELEEVL